MSLYQCALNFSEGRRPEVIEEIADAIRAEGEVRLIDYSADADHNRCVMTILGRGPAVARAVIAAAGVAVARIDLRVHSGVHPRIGALDVAPFVPLKRVRHQWIAAPERRDEAVLLSEAVGKMLAEELGLPVYFYEWSAKAGRGAALPDLRRGGFEALMCKPLNGERAPDFGPSMGHPTAGATIVGARGPLIAYNMDLDSGDIKIAKAIARRIREERDRLPDLSGVRALGLLLSSRQTAQVSMNLTLPDRTSLPAVYAFVWSEARRLGVKVRRSEIIGAIPNAALDGKEPEDIGWEGYRPGQILENWETMNGRVIAGP